MKKFFFIAMLAILFAGATSCKKEECNCPNQTPAISIVGYLNQPSVVASNTTTERYIPCGNTGVTDAAKVTYLFTAEDAPVSIEKISFVVDEASSIVSLKIGDAVATVAGGYAHFLNLNLVVPVTGEGLRVEVGISYLPVCPAGLNSGTSSSITMTSLTYIAKKGSSEGVSRNIVRTIPINTPASPVMVLVGSIPHLTVLQPNSKINIGETEVADVQISADSKGDISLNDIAFFVSTSGAINLDGYVVKDELNNTIGSISLKDPGFIIHFNSGYVVLAGQTKVFKIFALVTSLGVAGTEAPVISTMLFEYGFVWTDVSGGGTNGGCNATLLYGFPQNATIIKN